MASGWLRRNPDGIASPAESGRVEDSLGRRRLRKPDGQGRKKPANSSRAKNLRISPPCGDLACEADGDTDEGPAFIPRLLRAFENAGLHGWARCSAGSMDSLTWAASRTEI